MDLKEIIIHELTRDNLEVVDLDTQTGEVTHTEDVTQQDKDRIESIVQAIISDQELYMERARLNILS